MFAQMFPGMEWIPLIHLVILAMVVAAVVFGAIKVSRLLPLRSVRPSVAVNVRRGAAALVAISILVLFVRSCGPLGGPDPRERIAVGMTTDEVRETLGKPHEQHIKGDGKQTWIYYTDWGHMGYYMVTFDQDEKVCDQWLE
jgi:SmpA / OmlA family